MLKIKNTTLLVASFFVLVGCANKTQTTVVNPAAAYCKSLDGKHVVRPDARGVTRGHCELTNGQVVYEWSLYDSRYHINPVRYTSTVGDYVR